MQFFCGLSSLRAIFSIHIIALIITCVLGGNPAYAQGIYGPWNVTISVGVGGYVTGDVNCSEGQTCTSNTMADETVLNVVAHPLPGYEFDRWSGLAFSMACYINPVCSMIVEGNHAGSPIFRPIAGSPTLKLNLLPGFNLVTLPVEQDRRSINYLIDLSREATGAGVDYSGTTIYRFNETTQYYYDSIEWFEGFGWFSVNPDALILKGNEGFFLKIPAHLPPLQLRFHETQAVNYTPIFTRPAAGKWKILGNPMPSAMYLGKSGLTGTLSFPAHVGDMVYVFKALTQQYVDTYEYYQDWGWFSASDSNPNGPELASTQGFWVQGGN